METPPTVIIEESRRWNWGRSPKLLQNGSTHFAHLEGNIHATHRPSSANTVIFQQRKRRKPRRGLWGSSIPSAPTVSYNFCFNTPSSAITKTSGQRKQKRPQKRERQNPGPSASRKVYWRQHIEDLKMPTLPCSDQPREIVDYVLNTFDAVRRRLEQLEEVEPKGQKQIHLTALTSNKRAELCVNQQKRIGRVPGVEVGDIFYFRVEMCLVGLHSKIIEGIDYMSGIHNDVSNCVATCIVSSGVYDDDQNDPNLLIYSGSGSQDKAQKLIKGNLALSGSQIQRNLIRVIRTVRGSVACPHEKNKVYIYDGLYRITESWTEKGECGLRVLKHKLVREIGQPEGLEVWKKAQKWRENPPSRDHIILHDISNGMEREKFCIVNEVDNETAPTVFTYAMKLVCSKQVSSMSQMKGCSCKSSCLSGDSSCLCQPSNSCDLPYSHSGILVSRKVILYECNDSCSCSRDCRNRQVQRGSSLHFEVFKTANRGWGLRSWNAIRAGTFICEYAGETVKKDDIEDEDDFIFEATPSGHNLKWNCVPELIGHPALSDPNDTFMELPMVISAKKIGNVSRFINHSCSPNIFWQPVVYDAGHPHIAFFAIKHIPPMTELTFDYGDSHKDTEWGTKSGCRRLKSCLC